MLYVKLLDCVGPNYTFIPSTAYILFLPFKDLVGSDFEGLVGMAKRFYFAIIVKTSIFILYFTLLRKNGLDSLRLGHKAMNFYLC